jgi:hypothetical protein
MQKRGKLSKKKTEKSSTLTRSLSARISPLALSQRFAPGSFDFESILKRKTQNNQLLISPKKLNLLSKTNSMTGLIQSKLSKPSLKQDSGKTIQKKEPRSETSPDQIIYINELKMKLKEIKTENKLFRKESESKKFRKKVWNVVESFKNKLKAKLQLMVGG